MQLFPQRGWKGLSIVNDCQEAADTTAPEESETPFPDTSDTFSPVEPAKMLFEELV
jgi:hypothetical protein